MTCAQASSGFEPDGSSVFQCETCTQAEEVEEEADAWAERAQAEREAAEAAKASKGRARKRAREEQQPASNATGAAGPAAGPVVSPQPAARRDADRRASPRLRPVSGEAVGAQPTHPVAHSPLATTPRRAAARASAAAALEKQALKMKQHAAKKYGNRVLQVGDVVQIGLDDVDRAKLDNPNATCVVVEQVGKSTYKIANKAGVYKEHVDRAYLTLMSNTTAALVGLAHIVHEWRGMPSIGIRAIAASLSHAGGQGMVRCSCTGTCMSGKCACLKAGRFCNSRCHKRNHQCENLEG